MQNWRGLALVQGGKIVSDFVEEEVRGHGWKDVVFLEKGNIWETWARNRARLGSGALFMGRKSKSKRKERLSNRSAGGTKSGSKRKRRERFSNTAGTTQTVSGRKERLSNRSSGGFRRERLSNTSDNAAGNNLALTMTNNPQLKDSVLAVLENNKFTRKGSITYTTTWQKRSLEGI